MKCKACHTTMVKEKKGPNTYVFICPNCGKVAGKEK